MAAEHMDQVLPNLWIGDIYSAQDVDALKANGIYSIVSAMRWRVTLHHAVKRHQINIDDTDDTDVLPLFMPAIAFIQTELDRGRGVLVHCQAGMSRSATIVAAYLMYTQKLGPEDALELIRKARPTIQPNAGFLQQLEVFHAAAYEVSHRDKTTRLYYLDRTVEEVMNGDGTLPETTMFASWPKSTPGTPVAAPQPKRRIRCKMCRQELATREHMLDHGQLGPPTPFVPSALSPAGSRRPSMHRSGSGSAGMMAGFAMTSISSDGSGNRRPSMGMGSLTPLTPANPSLGEGAGASRRASTNVAPMSSLPPTPNAIGEGAGSRRPSVTITVSRRPSQKTAGGAAGLSFATLGEGLSESLNTATFDSDSEDEDDDEEEEEQHKALPVPQVRSRVGSASKPVRPSPLHESSDPIATIPEHAAVKDSGAAPVGTKSTASPDSNSTSTSTSASTVGVTPNAVAATLPPAASAQSAPEIGSSARASSNTATHSPPLMSASELSAQLYTNPKLAGLRTPSVSGQRPGLAGFAMTSMTPAPVESPPILVNPKCSGYFVEPMKWMDCLQDGQVAGKIVCPNKKCGAKLGNYEWPGMQCGCREWVTPGFCINRSKVDEVV